MALSRRDRVAEDVVKYFCHNGVNINGLVFRIQITSERAKWEKVVGKKELEAHIKSHDGVFPSAYVEVYSQRILIHPTRRGLSRLSSLIHEVLHVLDFRFGEDTVDKISMFLACFLVDSVLAGYAVDCLESLFLADMLLPLNWKEPSAEISR